MSSDTVLADQELSTPLIDDIQLASDSETGDDSTPLISTDLPESSVTPATIDETEDAEDVNDNAWTQSQPLTETTSPDTTETEAVIPSDLPTTELGRGLRTKTIQAKLHDYVLQTISPAVTCHTTASYALEFYVDCSKFSESHRHFLASLSSLKEPTSYRQAILDEIWRISIQD